MWSTFPFFQPGKKSRLKWFELPSKGVTFLHDVQNSKKTIFLLTHSNVPTCDHLLQASTLPQVPPKALTVPVTTIQSRIRSLLTPSGCFQKFHLCLGLMDSKRKGKKREGSHEHLVLLGHTINSMIIMIMPLGMAG